VGKRLERVQDGHGVALTATVRRGPHALDLAGVGGRAPNSAAGNSAAAVDQHEEASSRRLELLGLGRGHLVAGAVQPLVLMRETSQQRSHRRVIEANLA
jgi:hypothetical protein